MNLKIFGNHLVSILDCHDFLLYVQGGGPRVVLAPLPFTLEFRFSFPVSAVWKNKNVSSPSTPETQYCGEPPWPKGSVLGLRPPGFEFRTMCLEGSVISDISVISPSSGGSPGQFSLHVHKSGLKPDSFHCIFMYKSLIDLTSYGCSIIMIITEVTTAVFNTLYNRRLWFFTMCATSPQLGQVWRWWRFVE